jgi:hypothetical protein
MGRTVQVCILEITNDDVKAELVPITCARPAEEVLSREHIVEKALREERMSYFLELLAREGEAKFLEVAEIVDSIVGREMLPPAVKQEALTRIAAAREELGRR